jgi:hypothetical protein
MESAWFHGRLFHIQDELYRLSANGLDKKQIIQQLNENYRLFSKKEAFSCVCCGKPVEMVLPLERSFHFRHKDGSECSYSENYRKYQKQKEKYENIKRHDLGKTILRTILEGQLKPYGITIQDGYHYREKLSFIPDFILTFPNREKKWAIDYFTGFKGSKGYAAHIAKRKETYLKLGIKPFFFVDEAWLAFNPKISAFTTFVESELHIIEKRAQDRTWNMFLLDLEPHLLDILLQQPSKYEPFDTRSIVYINPTDRTCKILRFLMTHQRYAYVLATPFEISLEQALSITADMEGFQLYSHEENNQMTILKEELMAEYYQLLAEEERNLKEKTLHTEVYLQEEMNDQNQTKRNLDKNINKWSKRIRSQEEMDEDLAKRFQALNSPYMKRKAELLIHSARQHILQHHTVKAETEPSDMTTEEKIAMKKRQERKEKILNHKVAGEMYINGNPRKWKELVLYKFNAVYREEMTLQQLLEYLKRNNITFNQSEKLVIYPIREFLLYIAKEVGKDLNI